MKNALAAFIAVVLLANVALAADSFDCRLQPKDLEVKATMILKGFVEQKGTLPSRIVVGNRVESVSATGDKPAGSRVVHEAFYRPLEDELFVLIPFPIFGVRVSRDRHMFYVCGKADTVAGTRELTIYLMKGYKLDPTSLGTFWGDMINGATIKVTPVTIAATPLDLLNQTYLNTLGRIPIIGQLLQIPQIPLHVARIATQTVVTEFSGLGVERIVVTEDYVELASGVDLEYPSRARMIRRIDLKKARESKEGDNNDDLIIDPNNPSSR